MHRDLISIATPEGLTLDLELAGPGSRSAAAVVDHLLIAGIVAATIWSIGGVEASPLGVAIASLVVFGVIFGYFVAFEMAWRGQSPGKWLMHLRVLHDDGSTAGWRASAVRNLVRIVDFLPALYVIGLISLIGTTRDQRLGDLAAGSIVVRQLRIRKGAPRLSFDMARPEDWDVSAVSPEEIAIVRHFLLRRHELPPKVRNELAYTLLLRLKDRVVRTDEPMEAERFLEAVAGLRTPSG